MPLRAATAAAAAAAACGAAGLTVLPKPQSQADTGESFAIAADFAFNATGGGAGAPLLQDAVRRAYATAFAPRGPPSSELRALDSLLAQGAIDADEHARIRGRYLRRAHPHAGRGFGAPPRGAEASAGVITGCDVAVTGGDAVKTLATDESYTLRVTAPRIRIDAATVFGAMYGLETLSQLVEGGLRVSGTTIEDRPRFAFRATMIDTSRHWYPLIALKMHVDAMAYAKFNVLHWHVVDSVSFPFQSTALPSMSREGAWTPDHIYTHDDVKELVRYAMARGVRVIPEFDTPGHVDRGWQSLGVLTRCYDASGKPADTGPLNPTINETYDVLQKLFAEIAEVWAPEKFVHVGGDEVPSDCWNSNPQVKAWMAAHPEVKDFAGLETLFEQRLLTMLKAQGTSYIVWQEIFDNGAKILPDTVIDVWKGGNWQAEMAKVTEAGFHTVLSAPFYLNYIAYGADWPKYYNVEPANFTGGDAAEKAGLVGGVEACFWSEWIDATNFASRAWPRAAAVAERGWSARAVRDLADAEARIHEFRCKLVDRGINAEPIGMCGNEGCDSPLSPVRVPGYAGFCPNEWTPVYNPPF